MNIIGVDVHAGKEIPAELVAVRGDDGWTSLIFAVCGLDWEASANDYLDELVELGGED